MLQIQYFVPSPLPEAALPVLPDDIPQRRRRRLRLYLVGSETDTQHTIDHLHLHHAIDRIAWNPRAIAVPASGVLIQPDPGDVLRYLQRDGLFG
ncbi:hypothetical protein C7293_00065 [filamentous cyanobacterium CCT1]|nr:hypothetical protein C7293_00065 [filamentous cyanobacterium CCT1]PSN78309.1 hypothetical protein C8B47_17580 [filamentous cyanobacterium CCP4]